MLGGCGPSPPCGLIWIFIQSARQIIINYSRGRARSRETFRAFARARERERERTTRYSPLSRRSFRSHAGVRSKVKRRVDLFAESGFKNRTLYPSYNPTIPIDLPLCRAPGIACQASCSRYLPRNVILTAGSASGEPSFLNEFSVNGSTVST